MSPLIPTDPTLVVPPLDRSDATTPVVLLGYVLVTLLLLTRGVKHSWVRGRDQDAPADSDEPDPRTDSESEDRPGQKN